VCLLGQKAVRLKFFAYAAEYATCLPCGKVAKWGAGRRVRGGFGGFWCPGRWQPLAEMSSQKGGVAG